MPDLQEKGINQPNFVNTEVRLGYEGLQKIDWKEKLNDNYLSLTKAVEYIWIGEQTGQINTTLDQDIINDTIKKGLETDLRSKKYRQEDDNNKAEEFKKRIAKKEENGEQVDEADKNILSSYLGMAKLYGEYVEVYENELMQFDGDKNHGSKWYLSQRETIESAVSQVKDVARSIDERIIRLFAPHRNSQYPIESLAGRTIVLTQQEYLEFQRTLSEHGAVDRAFGSGGYSTFPRQKEPRAAVTKVIVKPILDKDQKIIKMEADFTSAQVNLQHEAVHIITDGSSKPETINTNLGPRTLDMRGFLTFVMKEDGTMDSGQTAKYRKEHGIPEVAMDEGCVTFLQEYLRFNGNLEKIEQMLDQNNILNKGYVSAAKETLKLVRIFGFAPLAHSYLNSDSSEWLKTIETELGIKAKENYVQKLTEFESQMGVSQD